MSDYNWPGIILLLILLVLLALLLSQVGSCW